MKAQLLMLGAIFLVATSFVSHSLTPPAKKTNPKKSAKVKRCGPSFSIINNSHSTVSYVTLTNGGTYTYSVTNPTFPISIGEQSGFGWTFTAQTTAASHRPVDVVVRDHYTQQKIECQNAAAAELIWISFSTTCNWYDIVFSDDTDICGIYP